MIFVYFMRLFFEGIVVLVGGGVLRIDVVIVGLGKTRGFCTIDVVDFDVGVGIRIGCCTVMAGLMASDTRRLLLNIYQSGKAA